MSNVLDTFGVPEYFTTHAGVIEHVEGTELMRIVRCIMRNKTLIPVYCTVIPAETVIREWKTCMEIAKKMRTTAH